MRSCLRRAVCAALIGVLLACCDPFAAEDPPRGDRTFPAGVTDLGAVASGSDAYYTKVAEDAPAGATRVRLVDVNVIPRGGLVLFHVAKGSAASSGDTLDAVGDLGRYTVHRVLAREQDFLKLSTPLPWPLRAADTQAVRVLEGGTVTVPSGATLKAGAWGPRGGGVVAIAADVLVNDGAIAADGAGFRGAPLDPQNEHKACGTSGAPNDGYAFRGEGLGAFSTDPADRAAGGSASSGVEGGGGVCHNGGGGGGGHGAGGGQGGGIFSGDARPAGAPGTGGGDGGRPIRYRLGERFLFGGGGGGGEANDATPAEIAAFAPASGGGVIWVRARQIRGSGTFSAGGISGQTQSQNGGYGGGAGGAVVLVADDSINCALVSARGGAGGASQLGGGGGGGGGGGRILVSAPVIACLGERPRGGAEGAAGTNEKAGGAGGTNASLLTTPEGAVPLVPF